MLKSLVRFSIRNRNLFPSENGVSDILGPTTIMTGLPMPDFSYFPLEFGDYVHTHDHPNVTNQLTPARSTGAIALGPANRNGGWHFMSLTTGLCILRYKWTVLPVTNDVITRVHELAFPINSADPPPSPLSFTWKDGSVIASSSPAPEGALVNPVSDHPETNEANEFLNNDKSTTENTNILDESTSADSSCASENSSRASNEDVSEYDSFSQDHIESALLENIQNQTEDIQQLEQDFETEYNNISEDLNDQNYTTASDDDDHNMSEQRSEFNDNESMYIDGNNNEMEDDGPMDDVLEGRSESPDVLEERSESPNADESTSHSYNLRSNPPRSSQSTFNSQTYRYSFLQYARDVSESIVNTVDCVNEAWNCKESESETAQQIKTPSKRDCLKTITKELKHLTNGQNYHKHRLQRALIELCHNLLHEENVEAQDRGDAAICLTQMSASKGIKMFGEKALEAMIAEYEQLDQLQVFTPVDAHKLTWEEKKNALNAIDLIKLKRTGKLKGRTVADGRKQRSIYSKDDVSSPALSQDGFFASLAIDALERRFIATSDVAGAFLKATMNDFVLVRLQGPAVDSLLRINHEKYVDFVIVEKGKKVLYVQLLKAMYGTLTAPILWYQLFADTLTSRGFTINPYDLCVANKLVNDKQLTICWYVDDLKVSHEDETVVRATIDELEDEFGKMNVVYGEDHVYLGMNLNIHDGKVKVLMKEYLQEALQAYGEPINSSATTPANRHLHDVDEEAELLTEEKAERFHHIVAKLLHVAKRARLDIEPTVAFLCRRVQEPTIEDWRKLKRLLQYIYGSLDLPRILSVKNFTEMAIYIDASHASHEDARGQTGGCIQMGSGVLHSRSAKQKINTKSSCETELVGNSDYLPYAIWFMYFLNAQGYHVEKKILYQDNQSTIKLLKNGRKSAGKQSKHISARFFWMVDRIKREDLTVEFCPSGLMLGDFFTKSLQGSLFRKMRDVVMGSAPIETLKTEEELGRTKISDELHVNDCIDDVANSSNGVGKKIRR